MTTIRYQLKSDIYMPLDGQWGLVAAGTVFDDDAKVGYAAAHVTILSPSEVAGTLGSHGRATAVRNIGRR